MDWIKGPLGSHKNYIQLIVLENFYDYKELSGLNCEQGRKKSPDKCKEFRYFLNAVESMNNVLDYLYYEHESEIQHESIIEFKRAVWDRYPALERLAEIANAYKHCVREGWKGKNKNLLWAKDLQKPHLHIDTELCLNKGVSTALTYDFKWPIDELERVLNEGVQFWLEYVQPDGIELVKV
ncbi:hypothetical protein [Alteromonas portus]|uniref:hypothetical protein n=1 Tax=Alteromonas portus TaxID=2565549 RepID=UPI003BF84176